MLSKFIRNQINDENSGFYGFCAVAIVCAMVIAIFGGF